MKISYLSYEMNDIYVLSVPPSSLLAATTEAEATAPSWALRAKGMTRRGAAVVAEEEDLLILSSSKISFRPWRTRCAFTLR